MTYVTVILENGPLVGGRVPIVGVRPHYGRILELIYTEETHTYARGDYSTTSPRMETPTITRRERVAIYKCQGDWRDGEESTATFVGILE